MKILIVNYRYHISGGPERYMFNVSELLKSLDHEVIPFSIKSSKNVKTKYENYFAEPIGGQDKDYFHELKINLKSSIDTIFRLYYSFHVKNKFRNMLKCEKPDIVYLLHHYNKLSPSLIDAAYELKIPLVMRLSDYFLVCPQAHCLNSDDQVCTKCISSLLYCTFNKCIKKSYVASFMKSLALYFHTNILNIYSKVDYIVCPSKFLKDIVVKKYPMFDNIEVLNTFIESESIEPIVNGKYILYSGRLTFEKGIDLLIRAFIKSKVYEFGCKLVVAGGFLDDIRHTVFLDSEIVEIKKHVIFLGFVDTQKVKILNKNSLFSVVPSRWYDNFPNTILEAFKHYKPVISANIGSLPELVIHEKSGLLFETNNISDLSSKINILFHDRKKIHFFSDNIKNMILDYSKQKHAERLIEIFNKCISRKSC